MRKKHRIFRRTLVKEIKRPDVSVIGDSARQTDDPDCTAALVVYCNQWECYSHDLCASDGLTAEKKAVVVENK